MGGLQRESCYCVNDYFVQICLRIMGEIERRTNKQSRDYNTGGNDC